LADAVGIEFSSAVAGHLFDENATSFNGMPLTPSIHKKYLETIRSNCNSATIHSAVYWDGCEFEPGKEEQGCIDFVRRQIEALNKLGIDKIRGHPLIYPKYSPQWLKKGVYNGEIKREQLITYMQQHIKSLVNRWRGKITEWIVVNEPYNHFGDPHDPLKGDNDFFQDVIGDEYIDLAFLEVRGLDPDAKLILNDSFNHASRGYHSVFHISQAETTRKTREIVSRLKDKGLIDGVGLQMHLDGANAPDTEDVINTMQSYHIPVYVTEFDVDMRNVLGTQEERLTRQAQIYADSLNALLQSGVGYGFCVWEYGDKYSWLENPQFGGVANADPTPFDDNFEPKPAYYALYEVLSHFVAQKSIATTTPKMP
jgi:endo-1,4-beta-xylanase